VSADGILRVVAVEQSKLIAQAKMRAVFAACVAGPFAFAGAMRVQSMTPDDTLFGRAMHESGFATPLVVLGFATLWLLPVLASVVGGDVFASEDRDGTWATLFTRSRSRAEVFAGKLLTALGASLLLVAVLAASSVIAGFAFVGPQPLIDLSGALLSPGTALGRITVAWFSVVPPVFALTALAALISVATRSSTAGIGIPVLLVLIMELAAYVDGPDSIRRLLITSSFGAWHGLLTETQYYRPLVYGTAISGAYFAVFAVLACRILLSRDVV
jgi:ABC-2 type transport system permease protein